MVALICLALLVWFIASCAWTWKQINQWDADPDRWYDYVLAAPVLAMLFIIDIFQSRK